MRRTINSKRRVLVLLAALALMAAALAVLPGTAAAQESGEEGITTHVEIGPGDGAPPNIECLWVLPEMGTYGPNGGPPYDDSPGYDPAPTPCDDGYWTGAKAMYGSELGPGDGPHGVIDMQAWPMDLPYERGITFYAAVDGPAGQAGATEQVYFDLFHPDGTHKTQVHTYYADGEVYVGDMCANGFDFAGALETGQMNQATVDHIKARCGQGEKAIFGNSWSLSKHQPCGEYRLEATAVGTNGQQEAVVTYFNVNCFPMLDLDFDRVDYEVDQRTGYRAGNFVFDDGVPTARNNGSGGMNLGVNFGQMWRWEGDDVPGDKYSIDWFDAGFGIDHDLLNQRPEVGWVRGPYEAPAEPLIPYGEDVWFGSNYNQTLCSNEIGKLKFSIHGLETVPSGYYSGEMSVLFSADGEYPVSDYVEPFRNDEPGTCNNDRGIWGAWYADLGPWDNDNGNENNQRLEGQTTTPSR